jgi:hypothetical protein
MYQQERGERGDRLQLERERRWQDRSHIWRQAKIAWRDADVRVCTHRDMTAAVDGHGEGETIKYTRLEHPNTLGVHLCTRAHML